jgi:hypothetical protein
MFKSVALAVCLVCMAVLIGAGTMSARTGGISAPVLAASTTNLVGGTLSLLPAISSGQIHWGSQKLTKNSHLGDVEQTPEENEDENAPTPEPSTILTFATALAIGGGVFLLGRLRKQRR